MAQVPPAPQVFRPVQICPDSLVADLQVVDRMGVAANHEPGSLLERSSVEISKEACGENHRMPLFPVGCGYENAVRSEEVPVHQSPECGCGDERMIHRMEQHTRSPHQFLQRQLQAVQRPLLGFPIDDQKPVWKTCIAHLEAQFFRGDETDGQAAGPVLLEDSTPGSFSPRDPKQGLGSTQAD